MSEASNVIRSILNSNKNKNETKKKRYSNVQYIEQLNTELSHRFSTKKIKLRTFRTYKSQLDALRDFAIERKITSLSEAHVQSFVDYLVNEKKVKDKDKIGLTGRTVNSYIMTFKTLSKQALKAKRIKKLLFQDIDFLPEFSEPTEFFRKKHLDLIDANIDDYSPHLRLVCIFVHCCMSRTCAELPNLKIGDVDFDRKLLRYMSVTAKNKQHNGYGFLIFYLNC